MEQYEDCGKIQSVQEIMKYYFKRVKDGVPLVKLYAYMFLMAGVVSFVFFCKADSPRMLSFARTLTMVCFGACIVASAVDIWKEMRTRNTCNLYDLARVVVCLIMCVLSFSDTLYGII